jgi:hypothetical protein
MKEISVKFQGRIVALEGDFYVDEDEKIRERISNLYRQVSSYPGRPSDSQMKRTDVLSLEMDKIENEFNDLINENLSDLNDHLLKNKLKKITIQTKEKFLQGES